MSCNQCKNNVEKAILQVEGVERVEINLATGQTQVYGKPDKELVKKAIESIGFEC